MVHNVVGKTLTETWLQNEAGSVNPPSSEPDLVYRDFKTWKMTASCWNQKVASCACRDMWSKVVKRFLSQGGKKDVPIFSKPQYFEQPPINFKIATDQIHNLLVWGLHALCYFLTICSKCQEISALDITQTSKGKGRESGWGQFTEEKKEPNL